MTVSENTDSNVLKCIVLCIAIYLAGTATSHQPILHRYAKIYTLLDIVKLLLQEARCELVGEEFLQETLVFPLFVRLPMPLAWCRVVCAAFPSIIRGSRY